MPPKRSSAPVLALIGLFGFLPACSGKASESNSSIAGAAGISAGGAAGGASGGATGAGGHTSGGVTGGGGHAAAGAAGVAGQGGGGAGGGALSGGSGGSGGTENTPKPCGGRIGDTCGGIEYCAYRAGQICGAADGTATCLPRPDACTDIYMPVCGCDGKTYSSDCDAASNGTGVNMLGMCP